MLIQAYYMYYSPLKNTWHFLMNELLLLKNYNVRKALISHYKCFQQ